MLCRIAYRWSGFVRGEHRNQVTERVILLGMLVGLAIFYRGSYQVPISLAGLALWGGLALLRPDRALLFVPLTVPLFFMPKGIWDERFGIRPEGVHIPLHEVVLLTVAGAVLLYQVMQWVCRREESIAARRLVLATRGWLARCWPLLLFVAAGTLGVIIVPSEGRREALREWRWLIIEPVLFFMLVRWFLCLPFATAEAVSPKSMARYQQLVISCVLGGALVGVVGVLQAGGINLAPLIGDKIGFSDDRLFVEGVQRVSSVYGHPNNLGLYMGRMWPLAGALALAAGSLRARVFYALCCLACVGGLVVSFSKGAFAGALVALLVMVVGGIWLRGGAVGWRRWRWGVLAGGVLLVGVGVLALVLVGGVERLNPLGESSAVRLKMWGAALAMLRDHPLSGVGLDQFLRHYPEYMHPSLLDTNEQYTSHPHNLLLNIWLRMGGVGVVAFGVLLARFFGACWQRARAGGGVVAVGAAAAMGAAAAHGLVDSFYFVPDLAFVFWLLVGVLGGGGGMWPPAFVTDNFSMQ
jgi:hypothetical protein